ncbi:MAG: hypothetical protein AAFY54_07915 [Cyanobacteria bacterium J06648_10]
MKQQQLTASLRLIDDLLSCPQGEEWIHLKRHGSVVNAQFVQVMEQVASQLDKQQRPEAATFLHNWAAKLHHILLREALSSSPDRGSDEASLAFIDKLLSCPEGEEEALIAAHKSLLGPELVHNIRSTAKQLREQKDIATALFLEKVAGQINQMWLRKHEFQLHVRKKPTTNLKPPTVSIINGKSADSQTAVKNDEPEDLWDSPLADDVPDDEPDDEIEPKVTSITKKQVSNDSKEDAMARPSQGEIAQGLRAIAAALQQLNQTLSSREPASEESFSQRHIREDSSHPLAHLEALEKAHDASWQLTTEEVEKLIGVKPRCHDNETMYERGNWRFTKVGQIGNQTAWQVSKTNY